VKRHSVVPLALGALAAIAVAGPLPSTAWAAGLDVCTLVSQAEAAGVLDGAQMQAPQPAPPPALQCDYRPVSRPLTFRFHESDNPNAQININDVVVSIAYGSTADSLWTSAFSKYGRDPDDEAVAGLGDAAYYVGSVGDLIVRQGPRFVEVKPDGDHSTGLQGRPYPDLHTKLVAILTGFARPAIQRMPASLASTPGETTAGGSAASAAGVQSSPLAGQPASGGAPWGAIAGIGALAVLVAGGYSLMRRRASAAPIPEVPQPTLPPYESPGSAPQGAPVDAGPGGWQPPPSPIPMAGATQPANAPGNTPPASAPTPSQVAAEGWPVEQTNVFGGASGELDNHGFPASPVPSNHLADDDGGFSPENERIAQIGRPAPASPPPAEPSDAAPDVEAPELPPDDLNQSEESRRKSKDMEFM